MKPPLKPLVVALGLLALTACSKINLALSLAPWYAERQATKMLPDLTPAQRQALKAEIQLYWQWNKTHMMPAYGAVLRTLAAGLSSTAEINPKDVALMSALLTGLYAQSMDTLFKPAAALLHSLDTAQIKELDDRFQKHQLEQRRLYLSDPAKAMSNRVIKLQKTLEDWGGKLSPAQRQQIESQVHSFPVPYQAWLDDQLRREVELIKFLRQHHSEALLQALLRDWWLRPRTGGEGRKSWQWDEAALQKHVQSIIGLLEQGQKERISGKLVEMAGELEALAMASALAPTALPTSSFP